MQRRQHDLERTIECGLALGRFIGYRDCESFVDRVEAVRATIVPLIKDGEAERAVALLETFIAGCYEKADEIDDSGGSFGSLVEELFCDWIRARQAAKADSSETVRMLMSWIKNDNYGYCHRLETEAVKILDRAALAAFEHAVREQKDAADSESHVHRRNVGILKAIYEARHDVSAYAEMLEAEGDAAPADCEALAKMCIGRRRPEDALASVERGLEIERTDRSRNRPARDLPNLKRDILKKLGPGRDALSSAWDDFRHAPSVDSYGDQMKFVPKADRTGWQARALGALDGADLTSRIDLLVKTKQWEHLAANIEATATERLAALSHFTMEPAAKGLATSRPRLAAKLQVAMARRILDAKKSKYYDAALDDLEQARKLMLKHGQRDAWTALAVEIRKSHRRKSGFMPAFERLAEGRREKRPTFVDRARQRWDEGTSRQGTSW